jgi:hypothetical protein
LKLEWVMKGSCYVIEITKSSDTNDNG